MFVSRLWGYTITWHGLRTRAERIDSPVKLLVMHPSCNVSGPASHADTIGNKLFSDQISEDLYNDFAACDDIASDHDLGSR